MNVYPSLTTGMVYTPSESCIKVYNLHGEFLQEVFGDRVDLSAYPQGIYLLQVNNKNMKVLKK